MTATSRNVILKNKDNEYLIPYTDLATASTPGRVKPDGTSLTVNSVGTLSVTGKQDTLVSGTNIKTVGGTSLLGSGDIAFPTIDSALSTTSENAVQNKIVTLALSGKQDTLVSGTNIKTVNNTSLLGSGNISLGTVTSVNNTQPVNGNVTLSIPTVDQIYDGTSANAQSGVAIASVLGDIESAINTIRGV